MVCIREIQKTLNQSVKKLIENTIEDHKLGKAFVIQDAKIKTPGGGQIIFEGMQNHTAESIKSLEDYDIAWVEEAQSLSQRSLDLLRPTLRKDNSELWFSWNPYAATDPVDALLRCDSPPPGAVVVQANWRDNPWFPDVLRAEMEYDFKRDRDKHFHVWEGHYQKNSQARVFSNWVVEEFESPPGGIYRFGADWGFSTDPTVLVRARLDGHRLYIDYEAYMVGCEIDQTPDLFDTVPGSRKWPIRADNARPETISYMKRHGFPKIMAAAKGKGSIEDGIEFLKSFEIVVHPRCVHTKLELENFSYKIDPLTGEVMPVLADKDNHVIDSLRYACEAVRKAQAEIPGGWRSGLEMDVLDSVIGY
jgi:phage terminase large subunit